MPKPQAAKRRANILAHEYSPERGHLTVTFHHGGVYRYDDVPADLAEDFGNAESRGAFLHAHIIGKFQHTKI